MRTIRHVRGGVLIVGRCLKHAIIATSNFFPLRVTHRNRYRERSSDDRILTDRAIYDPCHRRFPFETRTLDDKRSPIISQFPREGDDFDCAHMWIIMHVDIYNFIYTINMLFHLLIAK